MWTDFQNSLPGDSYGNSLCTNHKYFHQSCNMLLNYLVKFEKYKNVMLCSMWCIHREFSCEWPGERILKIGPHLPTLLSNIIFGGRGVLWQGQPGSRGTLTIILDNQSNLYKRNLDKWTSDRVRLNLTNKENQLFLVVDCSKKTQEGMKKWWRMLWVDCLTNNGREWN